MRAFFVFLVFSCFAVVGLLLQLSNATGYAEYGILWPVVVPDEAEKRLSTGAWPEIDERSLLTHGRFETPVRVANMERHLSPKKAPQKSPSMNTDSFCQKRSGETGRVYTEYEVLRSYGGIVCEPFVDIRGETVKGRHCCSERVLLDQPWWYEEYRQGPGVTWHRVPGAGSVQ